MRLPESVLDLLAGLLEIALRLLALPLGLEVAIVGGPPDGLLALAGKFIDLVADLVLGAHARRLPSGTAAHAGRRCAGSRSTGHMSVRTARRPEDTAAVKAA